MRVARVPAAPLARLRRAVVALVLAVPLLAGTARVASPYVVIHTSMLPSIQPGEIVLVDGDAPQLAALHRGDVVVFPPPVAEYAGPPVIKRVIALPGERVEVRQGGVLIDGRRLVEPYTQGETRTGAGAPSAWTVPVGSVFVMGDNRSISWDSRSFGPVALASVVGRAWLAYGPLTTVSLLTPSAAAATWATVDDSPVTGGR